MAAIIPSDEDYMKTSVWSLVAHRLPWLMLLMISATFTSTIITHFETLLSGAVPAESLTGTSGAVPLSPRAAVEQVYDAAVKAGKGGSVVINAVPAAQSVKSGKVGALRELTQDELSAYLNDSAVQKSRSNRFDSSYLLCKEKDGSTIVVWYESEADIAEKTELCALLGIKNVYVLK